jgi:hypothetical protein
LPRKPHRPPSTTTKRRKTRKTAIPYEFEGAPAEGAVDEASDDGEGWEGEDISATEATAVATAERPGMRGRAPAVERDEHGKVERHVRRDYSFVRGDVIRIVVIGGGLIISLIITSIFR